MLALVKGSERYVFLYDDDLWLVCDVGGGTTDLTFTVSREDADRAESIAKELVASVDAEGVIRDDAVAKVSIVGVGMRNHAGIAARMFRLLADNGINIQAISTSEIKTSCLIAADHADSAVAVLHDGFELGKPSG